jgi:hypothetical protein
MEIIVTILIVLLAGFILFKSIKSSSNGKCSNCSGCSRSCSGECSSVKGIEIK